jgi:thioredoxin 2
MNAIAVCPSCSTKNRLQPGHPGLSATCGRCGSPIFQGRPLPLDETTFDRQLAGDIPVLVEFWAPWCGHSRAMIPAYAAAARDLEPNVRVATVDTQAQQRLASRHRIQGLPTLVLFMRGREVARTSGEMTEPAIVAWTKQAVVAA